MSGRSSKESTYRKWVSTDGYRNNWEKAFKVREKKVLKELGLKWLEGLGGELMIESWDDSHLKGLGDNGVEYSVSGGLLRIG